MLRSNNFLLVASGWILFDKNINIIPVSGSAHANVPVNPVCPKLNLETHLHVGPPYWFSKAGLSKPIPLLLSSKQNWQLVNSFTTSLDK